MDGEVVMVEVVGTFIPTPGALQSKACTVIHTAVDAWFIDLIIYSIRVIMWICGHHLHCCVSWVTQTIMGSALLETTTRWVGEEGFPGPDNILSPFSKYVWLLTF
jgi:hypothetical protein